MTSDDNWQQPIKWNKMAAAAGVRYRVFCASLADVFDNEVSANWHARLWNLIALTPHLDWLLLTKRIGNADKILPKDIFPNVWLGISVVNQKEADRDIPKLLAAPATIRFLSMEPLLGLVNIEKYLYPILAFESINPLVVTTRQAKIDWVIVGGESGPSARAMDPAWVRFLCDQCVTAGVPFLFKQWGHWAPYGRGQIDGQSLVEKFSLDHPMQNFGKKLSGRMLDGRTWDEVPA